MKVAVIVPEEYMGDVIGDLNSRRGMIQGMDALPGAQRINAMVPLSEMFGYATDMRSKTQGRGQYTMEPSALRRGSQVCWRKDHFQPYKESRITYPKLLQFSNRIAKMRL